MASPPAHNLETVAKLRAPTNAMARPSAHTETIAKPRAPATAIARFPVPKDNSKAAREHYRGNVKSAHSRECDGEVTLASGRDGEASSARGCDCETARAHEGGGEAIHARERNDHTARASDHHAVARPPAYAKAMMEPRAPVDGYSNGYAAAYADGCGDGYVVG